MIADDASIYLSGFGGTHTINGVSTLCIIGDRMTGRTELDSRIATMFQVSYASGAITLPVLNGDVTIDGETCSVEDVKTDGVIVTLTLVTPSRVGEMMG